MGMCLPNSAINIDRCEVVENRRHRPRRSSSAHHAKSTLNRTRPLALHVKMTVHARRNSRLLEASHPGTWPAVGVERRVVPEDVERLLAAGSEPGCQFQPSLEFAHFVIDDGLLLGRQSIAGRTYASRPADDDSADFQRVAPHRAGVIGAAAGGFARRRSTRSRDSRARALWFPAMTQARQDPAVIHGGFWPWTDRRAEARGPQVGPPRSTEPRSWPHGHATAPHSARVARGGQTRGASRRSPRHSWPRIASAAGEDGARTPSQERACGRDRAKSRRNGLVRFSWPMVVAGP